MFKYHPILLPWFSILKSEVKITWKGVLCKKKKMFSSYIKAAVSNPTFKWRKSSYSQPSEDLLEGNSQVITISQQLALLWRSAAALSFLQLLSRSPQMPEGQGALSLSDLGCDGLAQRNKRSRSHWTPCVWKNPLKIVLAVQSPAHWATENLLF